MRFVAFLLLFLLSQASHAQTAGTAPIAASKPAQVASVATASKVSKPAIAKDAKEVKDTKPSWQELKLEQHAALAPLQTEWPKISESQKRKWLEISNNFSKLQPLEQSKLHSRMKDWAALSPQQRAQARLNFSTAKPLTSEEKQKQWQAYQALSPVDKQKLTDKAKNSMPNSAALATNPQNKAQPTSKLQPAAAASAVKPTLAK